MKRGDERGVEICFAIDRYRIEILDVGSGVMIFIRINLYMTLKKIWSQV
jgi:hypothetical protein